MTAQLALIPDPKTLQRIHGLSTKAQAHTVVETLLDNQYTVISASDGERYEVHINADNLSARCNCKYGNPYGHKTAWRRRSACSHALAAVRHHQQRQGRRIVVRPDAEIARHTKHRRAELGQGLWITSRAA